MLLFPRMSSGKGGQDWCASQLSPTGGWARGAAQQAVQVGSLLEEAAVRRGGQDQGACSATGEWLNYESRSYAMNFEDGEKPFATPQLNTDEKFFTDNLRRD